MTISYQGLSSDVWTRSLRLLNEERARVKARAQTDAGTAARGP